MDNAQQVVVTGDAPSGVLEWCLYWLNKLVEPVVGALTEPVVYLSVLAMLGGALLSVLVTEWLKRFSPLMPWLFEGKHWILKVRLLAAVIGGVLGCVMAPDGIRVAVVVFVGAAAASPTLYDLAYKLWPDLTDRLLRRISGPVQHT